MSRLSRLSAVKILLGIVLIVLSIVGITLGVEGGSAAASSYPIVDHQLCYVATASGFSIPPAGSVRLIDQFAPNGFVPVIGPLKENCNPVVKTITTATGKQTVTPITNPQAHLACFKITAPTQAAEEVSVKNQFGTGTLEVGQPQLLCLPTWKSLTGPPQEPTPQPPNLNHFTCYAVSYVPGTAPYVPPGAVSLQDEFATTPVTVTVGAPKYLCLPTEKIITTAAGGTVTYPIINPNKHLLCFKLTTQTPFPPTVFDLNQFGSSPVAIVKTKLLCLPSDKTVITKG